MAPSRFERLCRPKLFELRYLLLAKLSTEHQHDRIMAQKQLAELAISPDILDLARQGVRQHIASMIHSMVYELAARISKNAYTKDTLPDTIDSMANKIWELFLNNMFGRGSWTKAEAFARLLLHETACFLRVSSWNAEEKQEFVNYYARECTSDKLFSTIFCDKFETSPPAISQHLKVLREVELVIVEKDGQHRMYQLNVEKMYEFERWTQKMTHLWNKRFDALDKVLEVEKKKLLKINKNK